MLLTEILNSLMPIAVEGNPDNLLVAGITADSRKVTGETLFVAVRGYKTDGHSYISQAVANGAVAVICEQDGNFDQSLTEKLNCVFIKVKNSRLAMANISDMFFCHPSQELILTGITGTKGKTTTGFFLKSVFDCSGNKSGLLGTIANYVADRQLSASLTTPEPDKINSLLDEMISVGCSHCVMEVSSHAVELNRVDYLDFDFAIYTNLGSDHLDFHETLEEYFLAKKKFFDKLKPDAVAVVNSDDPRWQEIIRDCKAEVLTYGQGPDADFIISDVNYDLSGSRFKISYLGNQYKLQTKLIGGFNAYNAAAAFAVGVLSGIAPDDVIFGIKESRQVPGRFEVVGNKSKKIIVDYSHTAGSLEQALLAIKNLNKENLPVITLFGCGGDRDKTKRPEMGEIASRLSDSIIVTSDNPRTEDPELIIKDIVYGIKKDNYKIIVNRREAIKSAVLETPENSVILIAGKGHETYQEVNGIKTHFSDKETALEFLK